MAECGADGAAWRDCRHRRHVAGRWRYAAEARASAWRVRELSVDRRGLCHRLGHRRAYGDDADDGGAATDRSISRVRCVGSGAGRHCRVLSAGTACEPFHNGRAGPGGVARFPDVHREFDGIRQTAGDSTDTSDHVSRAKLCESVAARRGDSVRRLAGGRSRAGPVCFPYCRHWR